MSSNNANRFSMKQEANPGRYGVLLEVRADNKLYVVPSDNLNPKNPRDLFTIMDVMCSALAIMAEVRLMEMEGEGKETFKDAVMCHINSIKSMLAKYMPKMKGKLVEVVDAIPRLHG